MMKKSLLLTVLLFSAVFGRTAWGQNTLTVCDGTYKNSKVPVWGAMSDVSTTIRSEFVIPGTLLEDLEIGSSISALTFYLSELADEELDATYEIYMSEIDATTLDGIVYPTNKTVVYTGTLDVMHSPLKITFTHNYIYDGGNLLIGTNLLTPGDNYPSPEFYGAYALSAAYAFYDIESSSVSVNFIPKTTFEYTKSSSYDRPQDLVVYEVSEETVELRWGSPSGSVTGYKYKFKEASASWPENDVTSDGTSVVFDNLSANTLYKFRVKAVYEGGESAYTAISFRTDCGLRSLPYEYGFEDSDEIYCWTMIDCSSRTGVTNSSRTGNHGFQFGYPNYPQYLISPQFDGNDAITASFYYRIHDENFPETFQVGYSTTTTDPDAFTWRNEVTAIDKTNWILNESTFPVGTKYIAVKYNSNDQYFLYIDDFSFDVAPSCPKPTSFSVSNITRESADISWVSDADLFDIRYKKLSDTDWDELYLTENSYHLDYLEGETEYEVQVKAICGGEDGESDWSQSLQFITSYATPVVLNFDNPSYTDDFEGDNLNWKFINGKLTNEWYWGTATNNGGSKAIYISNDGGVHNNYTNDDPTLVYATKSFRLLTTRYNIDYDWIANGSDGLDYLCVALIPASSILTASNTTDNPFWNGLPEGWISLTNTGNSMLSGSDEFRRISVSVNIETEGDYKVVFVWRNDDKDWGDDVPAAIDNFHINMDIVPTGMVVSDITTTSAVVSWNDDNITTSWNLQYREEGEEWSSVVEINGTPNYDFNNTLDSGTTYEVRVQFANGTDWASRTFATPICDDEDKCEINYELTDAYGDGWTGNAIQLVDFSTNEVITTLTISDGNTLSGSYSMCNGRKIKFIWVSGSWGEECGFTITDPVGNDIVSHSVGTEPEEGELAVYTHYCNPTFITAGEWNTASNWSFGEVPASTDDVKIVAACTIPSTCTAQANTITLDGGSITIEDGGQLICNNSVVATVQKTTEASTEASKDEAVNKWYAIASPVSSLAIDEFAQGTHNVYRYIESTCYWNEYRNTSTENGCAQFTLLENGRGYLYRSTIANVEFTGTVNVDDVNYTLSCDNTNEAYKGFNLIGNPFTHDIYKGATGTAIPNGDLLKAKYYVLETNGTWTLTDDGTEIPSGTAILVQAESGNQLTIANTNSTGSKGRTLNDNIWFTLKNSDFTDVACVEFHEGRGLNKVTHYSDNAPMLYINNNGERFASANLDYDTKIINLGFEAKTIGKYTLSLKANGNFSYLHLIDKLTGEEVDMLVGGEYSFMGSPSDDNNRFIVKIEYSDNSEISETFAYQSGNDIVVTGEGELQIFDVMGRMVKTRYINGVETINVKSQGVYIFRLNEKTQKMIIK